MKKFTSARARFNGKLAGIETAQLRGLDYEKETLKERTKEVESKIEEVKPFLDEYFFRKENDVNDNGEFEHIRTESDEREYYKYSPNTTDELSEDINICKYIEQYASYLLNSKDLPREKQQEYTILSEEDFKKQLLKEMTTGVGSEENVVMDTRPSNDYNNLDLKITEKDLNPRLQKNKYGIREKDIELAKVLNDYETLREYIRKEMQKLKNGEPTHLTLYQMKSLLASLMGDMHDSKKMILGVRCQAKRLGDESPYNDFSELEYWNEEHIKQCLRFCPITDTPRPDDMMSHIGYDLKNAIDLLKEQKKLDDVDLEIIECYNAKFTLEEIGREVNMKKQSVDYRIKKICLKITEVI